MDAIELDFFNWWVVRGLCELKEVVVMDSGERGR